MRTIGELLDWGVNTLLASDQSLFYLADARTDASVLLASAMGQTRTFLMAFAETEVGAKDIAQYQTYITSRQLGTPVAYLLGEQEFWSLPLYCNESTLIPRPDTECLVERVLELVPNIPGCKVIDLGTGTGAIALALASERPHWDITGLDQSDGALAVAQRNAQRNELSVRFQQGNWLSGIAPLSVDIIVSNPPYIAEDDPHLRLGDVRFEPASALVAANNGLDDFVRIATQSYECLAPGGWLFFEHGYQQQAAIIGLLQQLGYTSVTGYLDYAGHPRNISAIKPEMS